MRVELPRTEFNKFLMESIKTIVIDANIIIPPDYRDRKIDFDKYKNEFLDPLFEQFDLIYIHEAVFDELILTKLEEYVSNHPKIIVKKDSDLSDVQLNTMETIISIISPYTNYSPNNKKDKGEVKSIAYAVAVNIPYFTTRDQHSVSIIERNDLQIYLSRLSAIRFHELLYIFEEINPSNKFTKALYNIFYKRDYNPTWSAFITQCKEYYQKDVNNFLRK